MIVLQTARLLFRPHEPRDLEPYCAMEQDAGVRGYVGGAPRTREAAEARLRAGPQGAKAGLGLLATVLKATGDYIGRCGLYPHLRDEVPVVGEAVLAFYLARPYWAQGFATEAGRAFVEFGFRELRLQKPVATVDARNEASVRVLEKLGFGLDRTEFAGRTFLHFSLSSFCGLPVPRAM